MNKEKLKLENIISFLDRLFKKEKYYGIIQEME